MKKIIFTILLSACCQVVHSQTIIDTIELAYTKFDAKKYDEAGRYFSYFIDNLVGDQYDNYFAAICYLKTGDLDKAWYYADRAATGIHDYYMMLDDSLFYPLHDSIRPIYNELHEFYCEVGLHKRYEPYFTNQRPSIKTTDSVFNQLTKKDLI